MGEVVCKRVYEAVADDDGIRVLVDRLWPRGLRKDMAQIDCWAKQAAPSTELRRWFGHDPQRFEEFRARYADELTARPEAHAFAQDVRTWLDKGNVTLLYAAKDPTCNHALVLRDWLVKMLL